jgi:hypothetical protein
MNGGPTRILYPARRAIEHAVATPGAKPRRLFAVLWPLWQVETAAQFWEEQPYEVLDRFLVRGVLEGLTTPAELSRFFGVPDSLVQRCLDYLSLISHVQVVDGVVTVTELGIRSARDEIRYVPKENRQRLLFDRFTLSPLPRGHYERHYDGSLRVLSTHDVSPDDTADRIRFEPFAAWTPFRNDLVRELAARSDRTKFNLPSQLHKISVVENQFGYMPAYLIETEEGLFAYSGAVDGGRDPFLEDLCKQQPTIKNTLDAEASPQPREIWLSWLAERGQARGSLSQLANGVWRMTLPASAFGSGPQLPLSQVGSFELRQRLFAQLWCDSRDLRQMAACERALDMAQLHSVTGAELRDRIAGAAQQLEIDPPALDEIRKHAKSTGQHDRLARLDTLE